MKKRKKLGGWICDIWFSAMRTFRLMLGSAALAMTLVAAIFAFGDLLFAMIVVVDVCGEYAQNGLMRLRGVSLLARLDFSRWQRMR